MVDPLSYFSFHPVFHDWYNKGDGMCYPVSGMVHIKEPLLLIKIVPHVVAAAGFLSRYLNGPLSCFLRTITIYKNNVLSALLIKHFRPSFDIMYVPVFLIHYKL